MAPSQKRKRGDYRSYSYSHDDDNNNNNNSRPSPHRPQNLSMAQQHHNQAGSPRGGRRGSRTMGRGGAASVPHSPSVTHASPTTMSPPTSIAQANRQTATTTVPSIAPTPTNKQEIEGEVREAPESNEYMTPARMSNWNADARSAVVQAAITARRSGNLLTLGVVFDEIVAACLDKLLDASLLGSVVRDILTPPHGDFVDAASLFLDSLSTLTEHASNYDRVRQMLLATNIPASKMRGALESNLLTSLELVRPSFPRVAIRKATHALYSQSNFNLLREETEGYSKLMTAYFTTVYNEPPNQAIIADTLELVRGLTGTFHLDVGRVLDVTLDVFANLLVRHGRFFIKLLRSSEWWPKSRHLDGIEWEDPDVSALPSWALPESHFWYYSEEEKAEQLSLRQKRDVKFWKRVEELGDRDGFMAFFELGTRRITRNDNQDNDLDPELGANDTDSQQWAKEWMAKTNTLPPSGSKDAAQLLGFKLRFYASDARDTHDVLPENLMYLAALLIKIGFISILDLYPHLYPADTDMPAHRDKLLKLKQEKEARLRGNSSNALAMAGALPDDTLTAPAVTRLREAEAKSKPDSERSTPDKSDDETCTPLPDPIDQKASLLRSLLCIGAIPEAFFILGRYPWMLEVYPDLHAYVSRLAHHSLSKVYEWARPTTVHAEGPVVKGANSAQPRSADYIPRRVMRWAKLEEKDGGDGIEYRFYWEDWMDNVPVCQGVDDVFKLCTSLLGFLGPECGRDAILLTKLARIARKSLSEDPSDGNRNRWIEFSATFLGPALSFTGQNPGVVNEVWDLFQRFDTLTRYRIYHNWFGNPKAALRVVFQQAQKETKDICRRVSTENTRDSARAIAKLANSCPGVVFQQALALGQSYSNMIDTLVECSRYLTFLGYDCLTWTFITAFNAKGRVAVQGDGMLTKSWLKNTATFIGKVYRRYSMMNPTPILQHVAWHLLKADGELHFLSVLEQLVTSMAGIGLGGPLTESLVLAVSSGPVLRAFTLEHHLGDHRHQTERSAKRLLKCTREAELISQILIALGQLAEDLPDREELQGAPTKVVSANQDNVRSFFAQYLDFVQSNLSVDEIDKLIPGVVKLIAEDRLEPQIAFAISRLSIAARANAARLETPNGPAQDLPLEEGAMVDVDAAAPTANGLASSSDVEMKDATDTGALDANESRFANASLPRHFNHAIQQLAEELKANVPHVYGNHGISPEFYVTFWQLALIDIYIPTRSNPEEDLCKAQYKDAQAYYRAKVNRISDRRNVHQDQAEKRQARDQLEKLEAEYIAISKTAQLTVSHLQDEMYRWFEEAPMIGKESATFHTSLLEKCFLPRLAVSMQDAQFAASMIKFMHKSGVPGFRTMMLLDRLFLANKLMNIIRSFTEENSKCLGRFLNDILKELQSWHDNRGDKYAKYAHGEDTPLPGFGRTFNPDRTPDKLLPYADFRVLLHKWHKELCHALKTCFEKGEYMEIRNSINILKAVSPIFPKVDSMGRDLRQLVQNLANTDSRSDVKVAANSLLSEFKKSERLWVSEGMFCHGELTKETNRAGSEPPKTAHQETPSAKLYASALAFQPKSSDANGTPRPTRETIETENGKKRITTAETGMVRGTVQAHGASEVKTPPSQSKDIGKHTVSSASGRPESRNGLQSSSNNSRVPHALPIRPDAQPPHARPSERVGDRQAEYHTHSRTDTRGPMEYGRSDRAVDTLRERELSPSRRPRARTPDRSLNTTDRREWPREYDERSLRAPPRDARGPQGRGPAWSEGFRDPRDARDLREMRDPRDHRDVRDSRDPRDRADTRVHSHPQPLDARNRMHSGSGAAVDESPHRRDASNMHQHQGADRNGSLPPRPPPSTAPPGSDRAMINPDRAAYINDDRGRNESLRPDRDMRRDRGSRPQSPRRGDERPPHHSHGDPLREQRDTRPPPYSSTRDRREEPTAMTPTGPRGGRNDATTSRGISRDMFQPTQSSRAPSHQAQDPNYGRLNPPTDTIPSGPRNPVADRRDSQAPATAPPATPVGIHPSRLTNFRGPPLQTDVPGPPTGPRSSNRTPQGPLPSPSSRGPPPTGPSTERNGRNQENRSTLRAINNVLTQSAPSGPVAIELSSDRSARSQNPQVRGRGANRANGPQDAQTMPSPHGPQSHPGTPNSRAEGQHSRPARVENPPRADNHSHDDGRLDSRVHRDGRRSERSGRGRSRSLERSERRPDAQSSRNGPAERVPRSEEPDRTNDRERGAGREKRGIEREGGRRERDRDGERSTRDRHERPRESDSRRSGREDARDGRKRGREPEDPQRFEDPKRRRSG